MKIVNLTASTVVVYNKRDVVPFYRDYELKYNNVIPRAVFKSEHVAWVRKDWKVVSDVNGIPIQEPVYHGPKGLPDPSKDTMYIVSYIVAEAARQSGRTTDDLLIASGFVYNHERKILGCTAFRQIEP